MSSVTSRARLPAPPRRYRFALTALADAIFQLLLFFMLSSSLAQYSLITVRSAVAPVDPDALPAGAGGLPGQEQQQAQTQMALPADAVIWAVDAGEISAGGQTFPMAAVGDLAEALATDPREPSIILVVRAAARVEDVTGALEALKAVGLNSVQITADGG